jgi:hypothetical protein
MEHQIQQNLHTLQISYLFNNNKTHEMLRQLYAFKKTGCKKYH